MERQNGNTPLLQVATARPGHVEMGDRLIVAGCEVDKANLVRGPVEYIKQQMVLAALRGWVRPCRVASVGCLMLVSLVWISSVLMCARWLQRICGGVWHSLSASGRYKKGCDRLRQLSMLWEAERRHYAACRCFQGARGGGGSSDRCEMQRRRGEAGETDRPIRQRSVFDAPRAAWGTRCVRSRADVWLRIHVQAYLLFSKGCDGEAGWDHSTVCCCSERARGPHCQVAQIGEKDILAREKCYGRQDGVRNQHTETGGCSGVSEWRHAVRRCFTGARGCGGPSDRCQLRRRPGYVGWESQAMAASWDQSSLPPGGCTGGRLEVKRSGSECGATPLWAAAGQGHVELVERLIAATSSYRVAQSCPVLKPTDINRSRMLFGGLEQGGEEAARM
eukprot:3937610-Rhodomonas_salina.2